MATHASKPLPRHRVPASLVALPSIISTTHPAGSWSTRCFAPKTHRIKSNSRRQSKCGGASCIRPIADEVVIDACQTDARGIFQAPLRGQFLDGLIEVEQQCAGTVVTHHALQPEEGSHP